MFEKTHKINCTLFAIRQQRLNSFVTFVVTTAAASPAEHGLYGITRPIHSSVRYDIVSRFAGSVATTHSWVCREENGGGGVKNGAHLFPQDRERIASSPRSVSLGLPRIYDIFIPRRRPLWAMRSRNFTYSISLVVRLFRSPSSFSLLMFLFRYLYGTTALRFGRAMFLLFATSGGRA